MGTSDQEAVTRGYLEQMMVRFLALGVPLDQATSELAEVEAHIQAAESHAEGSHAAEIGPVGYLGDPQTLASSLVPVQQRMDLYNSRLRRDITTGLAAAIVLFLAWQTVLSFLDEELRSVPRMLIIFVLACLYGIGQMSYGTILLGVSDDDDSLRPRGFALVALVAFGALITFIGALTLAGADFSGDQPFVLESTTWLGLLGVALVIALLAYWRTYRLGGLDELVVDGEITGQIVHEMNHNGIAQGWVRYGVNGEDLRDPDYSVRNNWRTERTEGSGVGEDG